MLYCVVLYCIIQCSTTFGRNVGCEYTGWIDMKGCVLCRVILWCVILCCAVLCCIVLCCIVLCCVV